ncbi:SDR family oxidoreductase [Citricoccus sp. SGAir0253]|uniref:SDR family oxidoreductase n=1 Tax=Citricoccus sp. SGAir0253 TaxID=2567881 RepID=UPI0010CD6740|nr:SDR family oxidoreductase [Citricoccus sp. SGAir0253]QCU76963.1 SDR family oxidoreductase [Citricoccus sp. SGAir0253]
MSQRVLVTAGASGIGLAIAKAFAATGDRVHIADVDPEAVRAALAENPSLSASVGDVSRAADVDAMMADVREHLGGLDVLVSNAGIAGPTAPVEEYDPEAWNAVVTVNLTGSFEVVRKAVPLLKENGRGTILVMSSLAGRVGYPNRIAYATTKWGLVGFTKTLSLELGPHGITVNSIHPGGVEGPRLDRVFEGRAAVSGRTVEQERQAALDNQAIKSFTAPADIAALAVFLAGPAARTISGQQFSIDGDSKAAQ